jgi:hypothetical protein
MKKIAKNKIDITIGRLIFKLALLNPSLKTKNIVFFMTPKHVFFIVQENLKYLQ